MGKGAADDVQRQSTTSRRWRRPRCGARGSVGGGRATGARLADVIHNGELAAAGAPLAGKGAVAGCGALCNGGLVG